MNCILPYLSLIGLVINAFGAFLLAISTDIQAKIFTTFINRIGDDRFGTMSMEPLESALKTKMEKRANDNKILNRWGYILFVIGFILQLADIMFKK